MRSNYFSAKVPAGLGLTLLSGFGLLAALPAQAQVTYSAFYDETTIDVTGAGVTGTAVYGLNDSGEIAGSYNDDMGGVNAFYGDAVNQNGVDLSSVLSSPFQNYSEINKINNLGVYAGDFELSTTDGTTTPQGFIGTDGSAIQTSLGNSQALGINNFNDTVGTVLNSAGTASQSYFQSGTTGDLTVFDVPGYGSSAATAINDAGTIVGTAAIDSTTGPTVSYVDTAGAFSFLNIPDAYDVFAKGINNDGIIVGGYDSFPGGAETGFIFDNGVLDSFLFPDSIFTEIDAINSSGEIAGTYFDASGTEHGFEAMPVPEASTTVSFGLLIALGGILVAVKRKKTPAAS